VVERNIDAKLKQKLKQGKPTTQPL